MTDRMRRTGRPVVVSVGLRKNPLEHRPALEAAHQLGYATVLLAAKPPTGLPRALLADVRAVDPHDGDAFRSAVAAVAAKHSVAGVVTWSDAGVEPAARAARQLGLPGIAPPAARLARNKYLMRSALSGVPHLIPRFARVRTWDDAVRATADIGFPGVLKPAAGSGSKGIFQLREESQLGPAFAELARMTGADGDNIFRYDRGDLVYEELLHGSEHSVEGFVHRGETVIAGITDKTTTEPFRLELAHLHPGTLPPAARAAVHALTRDVVRTLGFDDCAFHLECMYHPASGARLIEVAARAGGDFIGSHLVGLATGVPFHENVVRVATGRAPVLGDRPPLYAGMRKIMAPAAGRLVSVDGIGTALGVPGVRHAVLDRAPGADIRLPPAHFSSSAVGALIATGDTAESVGRALETAAGAVRVEIGPAGGHQPTSYSPSRSRERSSS